MFVLVDYDVGAAFLAAIATAMSYVVVIIPAGLAIWAVFFAIGLSKKAAKKTTA